MVDDDGLVRLDLTILRHKEIPLWIEIIDGGGATAENSTITISNHSLIFVCFKLISISS